MEVKILQNVKYLTTLEEAKALSDPYRYKILSYFSKMNGPATVKQVADAMGEVPSKVYYHVKKLEKIGILQLIRTEEINGIVAKYYEPTAEDFEIKLSDDYMKLEENNSKLMMTEVQKMFSKLYDISKEEVINHLGELSKENKKGKATLYMENLYITDEEAEEFSNYVSKFINDHKTKIKGNDNIKKYHAFFSFMKVLDKNEDK